MSEWTREGSPMPSGAPPVTLGRLTLMKKKGGGDVQSIPLDAERITFGRDYDCDVRLYYSDVSKLHCEITFDAETNKATLRVAGTNGLLHAPAGGSSTTYKPPATIELSDRDIITIRKKPFRFEYGTSSEVPAPFSPAVQRTELSQVAPSPMKQQCPASPAQPVRRRASHRLSLVPQGKTFVPLSPAKPRRQSTLGLGGIGTPAKTAGKSKMNEVVHHEQEEQEQVDEEIILDVAHGDEGDKVYLEVNEESHEEVEVRPIHNNPFMTPQQNRKAPIRNTSAVPRTRRIAASDKPTATEQVVADSNEAIKPPPAALPKTPRSVPLPEPSETPYNPPATPAVHRLPTTPVPAKIVMSTPKGPATLRKALLLRSARKVWQESRPVDVEDAIEKGKVEVRRKSLSPDVRASRKSLTPVPEPPAPEPSVDEEEDISSDEDEAEPAQRDFQWVQEDGTGEGSFDSGSSGNDSLEADMSLDVPGQGVIEFTSALPEDEEEYTDAEHGEQLQGQEEADAGSDDDAKRSDEENDYEDFEQPANLPADVSMEEAKDVDQQVDGAEYDGEQDDEDVAMSLPGTPQSRYTLSNQFFTPQPSRGGHKHSRRSLGGIGGPPVRMPATPKSYVNSRAPGSLGQASRPIFDPTNDLDEEEEVEEVKPERKMFTPQKSQASLAEMKRRRETLATPRTLPAPPASGFKDPIRETRFAGLAATPTHRALVPKSPEPESEGEQTLAVPATPMDDIKKRLDKMRRQSVAKADRRATVGFVLPGTPVSKPSYGQGHPYSVNPARFAGQAPRTPILAKVKQEASTRASGLSLVQEQPSGSRPAQKTPAPSSPEAEPPSSPSTPLYTGLREMLKTPQPTKTPNMTGLKGLFPATPNETASPSLVGVKEMLRQPTVPPTPSFVGMRDMFKEKVVPPTPAMEGMKEMYEEEEEEEVELVEDEEEEEIEQQEMDETEDVIVVEGFNNAKDRNPTSTKSSTDAREAEEPAQVEEEPKPVATTSKLPRKAPTTKTTTSSSQASQLPKPTTAKASARRTVPAKATEPAEPASRPSRARKTPTTDASSTSSEPASRSTRAKRTASVDPESVSAPSRTTASRARSTRAQSTAEPEAVPAPAAAESAPSKPSRGRSTSSRIATATTAGSKKAEKAEHKEESKPSRGKKPLTQIGEQAPAAAVDVEDKKSTSSRAKRATPSSSTTKRTTTATSKAAVVADDKAPAAGRRRAVKDKENDEAQVAEGEKPKKRVGKAPAQGQGQTQAQAQVEGGKSGLPVPVARATRSRK